MIEMLNSLDTGAVWIVIVTIICATCCVATTVEIVENYRRRAEGENYVHRLRQNDYQRNNES